MGCGAVTLQSCVHLTFDEDGGNVSEVYSSFPFEFVSLLITARISHLENTLLCYETLVENTDTLGTSHTELIFED